MLGVAEGSTSMAPSKSLDKFLTGPSSVAVSASNLRSRFISGLLTGVDFALDSGVGLEGLAFGMLAVPTGFRGGPEALTTGSALGTTVGPGVAVLAGVATGLPQWWVRKVGINMIQRGLDMQSLYNIYIYIYILGRLHILYTSIWILCIQVDVCTKSHCMRYFLDYF